MAGERVCNTEDLIVLARRSARMNRGISAEWLMANADPDGVHLLVMALFGHNMDTGGILQHRIHVLVKTKWNSDPELLTMDILGADWSRAMLAEKLKLDG